MAEKPYRLRRLLPTPLDDVDIATGYPYPEPLERPWIRANMVASADGAAWGSSGRSRELSSAADRAIMATLRGLCDVVLVGAGTARIEGYRPVRGREVWRELRGSRPDTPRVAVVSQSMNLHPDLLVTAPADARTLVFTTSSAPAERVDRAAEHAEVVVAGDDAVDMHAIVAGLAERGLLRVLTEGGPHLLAELSAARVLDELCLTVSPRLLGPSAARIMTGDAPSHPHELRLAQVLEAEGTLFTRYLVD